MSAEPCCDARAWKKKAMAFVTRSHRHLWGKNTEDPQAFLFLQGLKNQFVKDMLMGWNKFGQDRPAENWGFETDPPKDKKIFFPSGIVVPFIQEKELHAIFIHPYDENKNSRTTIVPGSSSATLILGAGPGKKVAVVQQMFDGLFLFQEAADSFCVMIHPDPDAPVDPCHQSMVSHASEALIFSSGKKETAANQMMFPDIPAHCFCDYQSKENLKNRCLSP